MDKYKLPVAESSLLAPEHFKNTFVTKLFLFVPKDT